MKNNKSQTARTNTTKVNQNAEILAYILKTAELLVGMVTLVTEGRNVNFRFAQGARSIVYDMDQALSLVKMEGLHTLYNWAVSTRATKEITTEKVGLLFKARLAVALLAEDSKFAFSAMKRISAVWEGFELVDASMRKPVRRGTGKMDIRFVLEQLWQIDAKVATKLSNAIIPNAPLSWRECFAATRPGYKTPLSTEKLGKAIVVKAEEVVVGAEKIVSTVKVQDGSIQSQTTKVAGAEVKREKKVSGFQALNDFRATLPATRTTPA